MNADFDTTLEERAKHCSFVLNLLRLESPMATRSLVEICNENIARFARQRLIELCIGLQPLRLPAFLVCRIAKNSEVCMYRRLKLAELWKIATRVKHFLDRNE
jgi:hypothetical protein